MKCSACNKYKSRGARFPYPLKIPLLSPEDKEYFCPTGTTLSGFWIWEYFERLCSVINRSWEGGIEVQELSELCKPLWVQLESEATGTAVHNIWDFVCGVKQPPL